MACTAGAPDYQQDKLVRYLLLLEQPHLEEVFIVGVSHRSHSVGLHVGESAPVPVEACWQQPLTWKLLIQPSAAQHTSCCAWELGLRYMLPILCRCRVWRHRPVKGGLLKGAKLVSRTSQP